MDEIIYDKRRGFVQRQKKGARTDFRRFAGQPLPETTPELKFFDQWDTSAITSNSSWAGLELDPADACLNAVPEGMGESERRGKTIRMKQLIFRGSTYFSSYTGLSVARPGKVFIAVVLDTQTSTQQLNSEDVYKTIATAAMASPLRNMKYANRS